MAPIILPKHKSDFLRPQMQDGQPAAISHPERPSGLSSAIEFHPTTDAMSPEKRGEKPPHESLAQHVEANFWGSIFGGPEAVQREKVKRKEELLDPETPEVAEALAKESLDAPGATESTIIDPSTPFVAGELAEQSLGSVAVESKIIDPSIPMVTDTLAEQSLKIDSTMESKATSKPRPNHHSMRECTHGGRMCIPRMRGHGGHPRKPKSQENPEGKDPKGKNGRLARRLDFPGAMASVPSSVLCHFPSMQDTWICPKIKAREAEPAGGGAAVLPAVMAATGWAGTGMIGVHGGPTQITFEEGGLSTGWVLAIVLAAGIVALCLICGLRWCLKRRSRRRALRRDEAGENAVFVVELQEMKGVQLERDESKC